MNLSLRHTGTALTAILMLASCGNEPDLPATGGNPAQDITFATPVVTLGETKPAGRSAMISGKLPPGSEFDVYGYCVPYSLSGGAVSTNPDYEAASAPYDTKLNFLHPDVFTAGKITVGVSEGGCSYSPLQPWHSQDAAGEFRYSFLAFYPAGSFANTRTETAPTDRGIPAFRFEMPFTGGTETTRLDHTKVPDAMYTGKFNLLRSGGRVELMFNHLLAGFAFRIYNHSSSSDLTVERVTLRGTFHREMAVKFPKSDLAKTEMAASGSYSGTFTVLDSPVTVPALSGSGNITGGQTGTIAGGNDAVLFLLPDPNATSETSYLGSGITIDLTYRYGSGTTTTKQLDFKMAGVPNGGNRYIANLNFVGNDNFVLVFQDATDRWENGSDNGIIIQ